MNLMKDEYAFKILAIGQVSLKISELAHIGQVFPVWNKFSTEVWRSLTTQCGGIYGDSTSASLQTHAGEYVVVVQQQTIQESSINCVRDPFLILLLSKSMSYFVSSVTHMPHTQSSTSATSNPNPIVRYHVSSMTVCKE